MFDGPASVGGSGFMKCGLAAARKLCFFFVSHDARHWPRLKSVYKYRYKLMFALRGERPTYKVTCTIFVQVQVHWDTLHTYN